MGEFVEEAASPGENGPDYLMVHFGSQPTMGRTGELVWVRSPGLPPRYFWVIGMVVGYEIFFDLLLGIAPGWHDLERVAKFSPPGGAWALTVIFWEFNAGLPLAVLVASLWTATVRIGLGLEGIRLVTRFRTRDVPWPAIRPGTHSPRGNWVFLRQAASAQQKSSRMFWVTRDQARLILTHPNAPSSLFPPEYWSWVGTERPSQTA